MIKTDELLEEVNLLYSERKYQEMIELLNQAILEDSSYPELFFYRGIACIQLNRYDEAIDDLSKTADMRPDHFRAYYQRGVVWNLKQKYNKAVSDLNRAIELRPEYPSLYKHLGNALHQLKDYDKAIEAFTRAIEFRPEEPELYHSRGSSWRKKEEYDHAIADYNKAAELKPEGRTFFGLGLIYEAMKAYELAPIYYKRAYFLGFDKTQLMRIFSERFPALYIVRDIMAGLGKDQEAELTTIEWLTKSCKTWDDFMSLVRQRGCPASHAARYYALDAILHYYMGDPITAYRTFDTKFDSDEHPYSLTLRDQYYLVLSAVDFKEPDNGLSYAVEQARQLEDGAAVDCYYAGQLLLLHNDLDEALQRFEEGGMFLPALYGKLAVLRELGNAEAMVEMTYQIAEEERKAAYGFLNGIKQVVITEDMSFEEMTDKIFRALQYYELREEIEWVRESLHKIPVHPHLDFYQLLRFEAP